MNIIALFAFLFGLFILTAIPLHIAVKLLKGRTRILKTAGVNVFIALITGITELVLIPFGAIITFVLTIFLFKIAFHLTWVKAIIVWLLEGVLIVAFLLLAISLGIAIPLSLTLM